MKKASYTILTLLGAIIVILVGIRGSRGIDAALRLSKLKGCSVLISESVEPGSIRSLGSLAKWIEWRIGATPDQIYLKCNSPQFHSSVLDILEGISGLKVLRLDDTRIEFGDLRKLFELGQVEHFELRNIIVEKIDREIDVVPRTGARSLKVSGLQAGSAPETSFVINYLLASLAHLSSLELVSVRADELSDSPVFKTLNSLSLVGIDLSLDTPLFLQSSTRLQSLKMTDLQLSLGVIELIAIMPQLKSLSFDGVDLSETQLQKLRSCPSLQVLSLKRTNVKPSYLLGFSKLHSVIVDSEFPEPSQSQMDNPEMPLLFVDDPGL